MFKSEKKLGKLLRWRRLVALFVLALFVSHCGAAGAPTLSIPAPVVTKITISSPDDATGTSTITGDAGAVTGGNTVRAVNLTQEGLAMWWEPIFWGIAHAATTVEVVAAADGSFTIEIDAATGDQIQIRQIDPDGNEGTPIILTVPFAPLALTFTAVDLAVNPNAANAWLIGTLGGSGVTIPINFGATPTLGAPITLPVECSDPTAVAVDAARNRLIVIDNTSGGVCAQPLDGSPGSVLVFLTVDPLNIAIHQAAEVAVITNNSPDAAVEVSLLALTTDIFTPVVLPNPAGGAVQVETPAVTTESFGGVDYAGVVTTYTGGDDFIFLIDLAGSVVIGGGFPLAIGTPTDLQAFLGVEAVLVDADGLAHFLFVDVTVPEVDIVSSLSIGSSPVGVAVDEITARAFVTNSGDDNLSVIDLTSGSETVTEILDLGDGPTAIGFKDTGINQLVVVHDGEDFAVVFSSAL